MSKLIEKVRGTFTGEKALRFWDKIIRNEVMLVVGLILFYLAFKRGWWEWLEPFLTLVVLPTALATWYENWRARKRRFEPVNGGFALVALSVNTDMSRTVPQHFGRMPDVLISSVELCGGRKFLTIEDMNTVAKSVARACAGYRHTVIKLVLSGPPALAAQLTRYLPVDKYRIIFCYWDGQGYIELPPVDIQEYAEVSG